VNHEETNPYRSPEENEPLVRRQRPAISLGSLAMAALLAPMSIALLMIQPRFIMIFEEMAIDLPVISLVGLSPLLAWFTGIVALIAFGIAIGFPSNRASKLNAIYLVLATIVLSIFLLGAVLPLVSLIDSLS
jgi:hypothetical protein